jgi:polyphosphate kinase 2
MSKQKSQSGVDADDAEASPSLDEGPAPISKKAYQTELRALQIELVKLQRHSIRHGNRVLVLLEGRDAAGKDGSIKRITEYLSPRETRVVALGKPSDREASAWYFQRFVAHLPVAGDLVLFNRSWYNRAGVERVMGFCSKAEVEEFMRSVPKFEEMLVHSGIRLLKYYLDISRGEQKQRLADRRRDPLKQWKSSPIDAVALAHWHDYTDSRDDMLLRTHTELAPWHIVHANHKKIARLNLIRDMLSRLPYSGKELDLVKPDRRVVFEFSPADPGSGRLER